MGREAYLAKQAAFYDRYYTHAASLVAAVIVTLLFAGIVYGVYELIAFAVLRILDRTSAEEPKTRDPTPEKRNQSRE